MNRLDLRILELAAQQFDTVARAQLLDLGSSSNGIDRRIRSGMLQRVHPGVYRIRPHVETWRQDLMAALLAAGPPTVVSHESAAEIDHIDGVPRGLLTLTARRSSHKRVAGAVVHQISDVVDADLRWVGPLPVTRPARTIVDLAAVLPRARLVTAIEHAHTTRTASILQVARVLQRVDRPMKPGLDLLRSILDERMSTGVPRSVLESMLLELILDAGLPLPVPQIPLPGRQAVSGCADFGYPDARMILEADGRSWHGRHQDMVRDRLRDNEASRAGWVVLRFMADHLRDDPADVAETIRETRESRLHLLGRQ